MTTVLIASESTELWRYINLSIIIIIIIHNSATENGGIML